jgi:flagellar basal body rod protein FlgB
MKLPSLITDNIAELLVKIIEFTQARQKVLTRNINNAHSPGYIPMDLATEEFSSLIQDSISEHIRNQRLVLCDTENIKFGQTGSFEVKAVEDTYAKELLENDTDEYIENQINKLMENSLNQKLAAELLRQKQKSNSDFHTR